MHDLVFKTLVHVVSLCSWSGEFKCNRVASIRGWFLVIRAQKPTVFMYFRPKTWFCCMRIIEPRHVILTSVDSDEPVQPAFKLRNSKWCSVSSLAPIQYSSDKQRLWSDCAYAQADLRLCWSHKPHCWKYHFAAHILYKSSLCIHTFWPASLFLALWEV